MLENNTYEDDDIWRSFGVTENKKRLLFVWSAFVIFVFLYFVIAIVTKEQGFLWLLLTAYSLGISIFLLKKHRIQNRKALIMPVIFMINVRIGVIVKIILDVCL